MNKVGWLVCAVLAGGCSSEVHCVEGAADCSSKQADTSNDASIDRRSAKDSSVTGNTEASSSNADASMKNAPSGGSDAGAPHDTTPASASDEDAGPGPVVAHAIDKVDLLFVVDNSNSMLAKQASLKAALPAFIQALTTGKRATGAPTGFSALLDLHLGVVSTDMGIAGIDFGGCHADGGDDGRLQHAPHGMNCQTSYPSFLSYDGSPTQDLVQFAGDFGCIAGLGTGGCGFEQSLEAPLKALWPAMYTDSAGHVVTPNPITFVSATVAGTLGHGDVPAADGGNLGFLRNDPGDPSLIAIVLVTDEDDSSVIDTQIFSPPNQLPSDSPYRTEDINLRSYYNKDKLFDVQRYAYAFRLLRPDMRRLVFAAITGVPTDLVDRSALGAVDPNDDASRDAFFDRILNDPRMAEAIDPSTKPGTGTGNLLPSCKRQDPVTHQDVVAAPARRIVQLAKVLGPQAMVQSICQDDFTPAIDAIVDLIGRQLAAAHQ